MAQFLTVEAHPPAVWIWFLGWTGIAWVAAVIMECRSYQYSLDWVDVLICIVVPLIILVPRAAVLFALFWMSRIVAYVVYEDGMWHWALATIVFFVLLWPFVVVHGPVSKYKHVYPGRPRFTIPDVVSELTVLMVSVLTVMLGASFYLAPRSDLVNYIWRLFW